MKTFSMLFGAAMALVVSCTPAQISAFDAAVKSGQSALVPAEDLACETATVADPSGATAICTGVDTAGNAIGAGFTIVEDVASIAALVQKAAPKTDAVKGALAALHVAPRAAKGVK